MSFQSCWFSVRSLDIYTFHMVSLVFRCTLAATACYGVLSFTGLKGILLWIYKVTPSCGVLLRYPSLLITVKLGIVTLVLFHNFFLEALLYLLYIG